MYLEQLSIHGFKSFANKSILDFQPAAKNDRSGITAIVGPNGSGKSNVVDAIRWVLGEQSSKNLRGKKSEDVIFAGSEKKARNSSAEVSLRFNNEDKKLDLDYSEVELKRQLFRSGESDYLINNQKSRLQDIHYLLAQANIGQKSYTVIGQGMVDTVLNSTPQQRKEFFDEAAGIRQYQIKRDQAANKLGAATDNLKQGQIQLQELTPRLRSLQRQMKRWEQREEISSALEEKLNLYFSYHYREINGHLKNALEEKLKLEKEKQAKQSLLDQLQTEMQNLVSTTPTGHNNFSDLQTAYTELLDEKNNLTKQLAQWQGKQNSNWLASGQYSLAIYQEQIDKLNQEIRRRQEELTASYQDIKSKQEAERNLLKDYQKKIKEIRCWQEKVFLDLAPNNDATAVVINGIKNELDNNLNNIEKIFQQLISDPSETEKLQQLAKKLIRQTRELINKISPNLQPSSSQELKSKLLRLAEQKNIIDNQLIELRGQIRYLEEKTKNLSQEISTKEGLREKLSKETNSMQIHSSPSEEQKTIKANIAHLTEKIDRLETKLAEKNSALASYSQAEEEKKRKMFVEQQKALEIQKELNTTNQKLTDYEIELARWQTRQEDLHQQARQDLNEEWDRLVANWKNFPLVAEKELNNLTEEIQQLKRKKEMIGTMDDETKNEFQETKERHDWLEQQTNDLQQATTTLREVIKNLDQQIEKQFNANIKKINEKFSHYFALLFNGGKAELKIKKADPTQATSQTVENGGQESQNQDKEQIDDNFHLINKPETISGVDIVATPPGKKLQNISILSGGEKALTSIALICAIIANNTSPFVVLDEVDAALDEANSLRFAQILEELSRQTQFIVVTHNRATMEKAQLLYGITMGDDGISKLLSIKLEEGRQYTNR